MIADDINSNNANRTVAFVLGGAGGLSWAAPARTLTLSGLNTYTGPTTITAGCTIAAGSTQIFGPTSPVTNNGTLNITGFNNAVGSYEGAGSTTLGAATLTFSGLNAADVTYSGVLAGTGGITKVGTGTQTISGVNTYIGPTTVTGGTLLLDYGARSGANTLNATITTVTAPGVITYNSTNTAVNGLYNTGGTIFSLSTGTINKTGRVFSCGCRVPAN